MNGLWLTLLPFVVGSAVTPVQTLITLLLLQRPRGALLVACSFVVGLSLLRAIQGLLLTLMLPGDAIAERSSSDGAGPVESGILIVLAILLYATAVQQALADEDPDAPPPKWIDKARSISAARAFLLGIGLVLIGAKFWVFSLGVVGAVREAGISVRAGVLTYAAYVALAVAIPLTLIAIKVIAPDSSAVLFKSWEQRLQRNKARVVIGFSLIFGTWFLLTALSGLGVI
jgi:Sap-like sulfolipid-1-addressing protein